ncbi:MAG: hypothetical protein ACT4N9_06205 [Paracoccaceae bacterium]
MSDLDTLFAQARAQDDGLAPGLSARILADAAAVQAEVQAAGRRLAAVPPRPAPPGPLSRLLGLFGGSGPLASGVLAGIAGLALGYMQPEAVSGLGVLLASDASAAETGLELMPGFDALFTED